MPTVMAPFETVIGLEVHCQLLTRSKMFCSCSVEYSGEAPNTRVCPVCLGMPGVLPVINEQAIAFIVRTGLALNCHIAEFSKFDRKNYPYPDLMKGYQISQYDLPVCSGGWLDVDVDGVTRRVGITRVHMEEDTARLLHRTDPASGERYSLIDVNRSGTPLMEIVSEPDMRSPEEARAYLVSLRQILRYIGVSQANMEEGNFRCDANISLRPVGSATLGSKVEVKNMNSFRAVHDALEYEQERQAQLLSDGQAVRQETRGWVDERGVTVSQRYKEDADDYRYFPEPDLPPLQLSREYVATIQSALPELPAARATRLTALGLTPYEAATLTESRDRADYFDELLAALPFERTHAAKLAANWMLGEVSRWLNEHSTEIDALPVKPASLASLVGMVEDGKVNGGVAKDVFERMVTTGDDPAAIVAAAGLGQISDDDELSAVARKVIASSERVVADYRSGKKAALNALFGQVMRETSGRANPQTVRKILERMLEEK